MERPAKSRKKVPAKKPKKTADGGKITQKPKAAPRRKVSSGKTINPKKDRVTAPTRTESQHRYFEVLGSRIADRAYKLYVQRGQEHGHDIEDWLEAERQILPKEISKRS
ncbi:MAG: DUF2934 domain-containing protein [Nitrospirales bacterium]